MNTTATALFVSVVIGAVGLGLFIYGKKQSRWPQLVAGVVLCAYPYFVSNVWLMVGIALALLAAVWLVVRLGH